MEQMRKPSFGKPRSAAAVFSLSRKLPHLKAPLGAASIAVQRPRPQVGRPGSPLPAPDAGQSRCGRCAHPESFHPLRYICDKYPHPDPLQICGCETSQPALDPCPTCGHSARRHKPRKTCRAGDGCGCWAYDPQEPFVTT